MTRRPDETVAMRSRIRPDCSVDVRTLKFARCASSAGLYALLLTSAIAASGQLGFSRDVTPGLVAHYMGQFGPSAKKRLEGWKEFVRKIDGRTEPARTSSNEVELLHPVNRFFNGLPYFSDLAHWGVEDYWATPSEFLSSEGGDCEDYVIAKYYTLRELGIPNERLRLVYANTWRSAAGHMVLAYYPSPRADPLILDTFSGSIQLASSRPDLEPVFTFNDDDRTVAGKGAMGYEVNGSTVRQWRDLTEKLERELTYR